MGAGLAGWWFEQDEIQARFQAQIHLLRSEVEKKDQLISQLEIQLESFGVQPVIIPVHQVSSETHSEREEQTSSVESDVDDDNPDDDDDSRTLRYFAVSCISFPNKTF